MNKLQEAIERAAKKSWQVTIYIDIDDCDDGVGGSLAAQRGDSNCPHVVTYHPDDGHGYECYPIHPHEGYLESCWYSWDELIQKLDNLPAVYPRELIDFPGL